MASYQFNEDVPCIDPSAFVADSACVIGKVRINEYASVWFQATLRGDNEPISIGANTNVQESAVLHTDMGFPLTVGENVTIGHQAMLHGCAIGDGALIGMQAIVLNGACIGRNCLVGAGALVTERKIFPDNSLIVGRPAKLVRQLTDAEVAQMKENAQVYVLRGQQFKKGLKKISNE